MALRNVVQDGDPVLKKVCRPVTKFDGRLAQLLDDMKETLVFENGLGLAAPQVGVMRRVFIALEEPEEEELAEEEDAAGTAGGDTKEPTQGAAPAQGKEDGPAPQPMPEPVFIEFVNPEIIETEGDVRGYEGCLSFPGRYAAIARPERVRIRAQDRNGDTFEYEGCAMMARCLCHENNHLDGVTISDLAEYFYDPQHPHDLDAAYEENGEKQEEERL